MTHGNSSRPHLHLFISDETLADHDKLLSALAELKEVVDWRWLDTEFGAQVTKLRKVNADVYFSLSHTPTTCPSLKELRRQRVKPKLIIGITSIAGTEVLLQCPGVAEGLIAPSKGPPAPPAPRARGPGRR